MIMNIVFLGNMRTKHFLISLAFLPILAFTSFAQPKSYIRFSDGLLDNVEPQGWIREFLDRQCTGLSGHPEAMAYPYNTNLWNGPIKRMSTHGQGWWRYEQTAYYSDGLLRLGYALDKQEYIDKIVSGIEYTLSHATPEGRIGEPDIYEGSSNYLWPQAVFFRAMKAYYDATHDERIPKTLEKFYLLFSPEQISLGRNIVSIEGMMWTYGLTGNKALVELAEKAYELAGFELYPALADEDGCPPLHGVTFNEEMKLPAILYMHTGKERYRRIAETFEKKLVHYNMLPSGVPSSAERLLGNSVDNAHETCDIADFAWAEGYFLQMNGRGEHADRIEKAIFNAAPGAMTKDFKAIQYFSNANQFNVTGDSNPNPYYHGSTWQAYRPIHQTECCVGNVHRIMPNYVSGMWLRGEKDELVAALYGPCTLKMDGFSIEEQTEYPFKGDIRFVFHTDKTIKKSFTFRTPGWCRKAEVLINGEKANLALEAGEFTTIKRAFKDGDCVELHLDMPARITYPNGQGVSFEKGPVLFSYSIPTKWTVDETDYANMRGKKCGNPDFKCWSLTPDGDWAYGIEHCYLEEIENKNSGYPFENPPYTLKILVSEIVWPLVDDKFTPPMPTISVKHTIHGKKYIELVPYGCTQLRLTVFPQLRSRVKHEGLE